MKGWTQVDEDQVFLLSLDAAATNDSIAKHAYCVIDGIAERVPVQVLSSDARKQILDQRKDLGYQYFQLLYKDGNRSNVRVRDRSLEQAEAEIVVLKCQRRLPNATEMQLVWSAGITTPSGLATRQPQQLAFKVRPSFTAQLTCTRTDPRAGCTPIQPITVSFAAPISREQARAVRLRVSPTDTRSPQIADDEERQGGRVRDVRSALPRRRERDPRAPRQPSRRRRPRAGERVALPARRANRRLPAARQILGRVWESSKRPKAACCP